MRLPRTTGLAIGLIGLLAAPLPAHAQADPLAVFACERAYGETRHGDAAALCRPLAEAGSADAQAIMGTLHQNGQAVARDYAEAARWFDLSARQGHVEAQFNLAALYNYGAGVARDLVEAYAWYDLAADAGNGDAAAGRALVEKRLTPEQVTQAKGRAAEFNRAITAAARAAGEPAATAALPAPLGEAGSDLQTMVDELRGITEQAQRERSGDFRLLQRLSDLVWVYDRPWRVALLIDNFGDGNFTANPVWTVASGKFSVDPRYGLRNRVTPPPRFEFGSDGNTEVKLFGAILGSITKQKTGGGQV
ncbi:MAG: sel1 repeat family protein, partial [Proteobacteria bacterium]|nr:sel1 repeat family protein [Pseudomonadota bacterium]